jgi:hypothetical protein
MQILPTVHVRVRASKVECLINEEDYDEALHEKISQPRKKADFSTPAKEASAAKKEGEKESE